MSSCASHLVQVTPPAGAIVTLEEAKAWARIEGDAEDALVGSLIDTATGLLDGRSGYLRRAIQLQTWELRLEAFPWQITLPLPPVREVVSISYTAPDGTAASLDPDGVNVLGIGTDYVTVLPPYGGDWPACRPGPDAVRVRFTAGDDGVSPQVRTAILTMVATMFERRDGSADPIAAAKPLLGRFQRIVFA